MREHEGLEIAAPQQLAFLSIEREHVI